MIDYLSFAERQSAEWPLAAENYRQLGATRRRTFMLGDLPCALQLNPARIVSTAAKVDPESVSSRRCLLCAANRPAEQEALTLVDGWDLLLNPFPIFPIHFTIVSQSHEPQRLQPAELPAMAEALRGMAVFFNGAKAGSSLPEHAHCQAVMAHELPLLNLAASAHPSTRPGIMHSSEFGLRLPFQFYSAVVTPDSEGATTLRRLRSACGVDPQTGAPDPDLVNAFYWIGADGLLRAVVVPRKRHRPACYYEGDGRQRLVSPGAIDMTGVLITPRPEDFERLQPADIEEIYSEVAFSDLV